MQDPLVSVIIPVYNVEQYFSYCMASVLKQSYQNMEIILVDDESTDSSGAMCDAFARQDSRVKVIHKQNGGLSSARNAGIECMTGKYVLFIDSDDYVRIDHVQLLLHYAMKDKADLVVGSYMKVVGDQAYDKTSKPTQHFIFNRRESQYQMLARKVPMYAVAKLYKTELFKNIRFPEGKLYEDVPTSWNVSKLVERVTYVDVPIYYYRQRPGSIVNTRFHKGRMDQVYAAEDIFHEVRGDKYLCKVAASRCFFSMADNYSLVTRDFPDERRYLRDGLKQYKRDVIADRSASKSLKLMALAVYLSPEIVRLLGKCYKKYNKMRWKAKRD